MIKNAKEDGFFDENEKFIVATEAVQAKAQEEPEDETFVIHLTDKMDEASMDYLKTLLSANRGERKVLIKLQTKSAEKTIPLAFGIDLTQELEARIIEIAK